MIPNWSSILYQHPKTDKEIKISLGLQNQSYIKILIKFQCTEVRLLITDQPQATHRNQKIVHEQNIGLWFFGTHPRIYFLKIPRRENANKKISALDPKTKRQRNHNILRINSIFIYSVFSSTEQNKYRDQILIPNFSLVNQKNQTWFHSELDSYSRQNRHRQTTRLESSSPKKINAESNNYLSTLLGIIRVTRSDANRCVYSELNTEDSNSKQERHKRQRLEFDHERKAYRFRLRNFREKTGEGDQSKLVLNMPRLD